MADLLIKYNIFKQNYDETPSLFWTRWSIYLKGGGPAKGVWRHQT